MKELADFLVDCKTAKGDGSSSSEESREGRCSRYGCGEEVFEERCL